MNEEYNPEDFKDKIKNRCMVCGRKIPGVWDDYRKHGNWCISCLGLLNKLIDGKITRWEYDKLVEKKHKYYKKKYGK